MSSSSLPEPTRQHVGYLFPISTHLTHLHLQAQRMAACSGMWAQLAFSAHGVIDRYNTLVLEYFDGFDVWYEEGLGGLPGVEDGMEEAPVERRVWKPDAAMRGSEGVRAVVGRWGMGYLGQLDFEVTQMRLYMKDHESEERLTAESFDRFLRFSARLREFGDIKPEMIPALLMSDVALAYRYLVSRSVTGGLDGESLLLSDSATSWGTISDTDTDSCALSSDETVVNDELLVSPDEEDSELGYIVLDSPNV